MKGVEKQIIILNDDEIATIIYSIKGTTERAWCKRAIIYIMLDCGLRVGEISSLEKDSINFNDRTILIKGEYAKGKSDRLYNSAWQPRKCYLPITQKDETPMMMIIPTYIL